MYVDRKNKSPKHVWDSKNKKGSISVLKMKHTLEIQNLLMWLKWYQRVAVWVEVQEFEQKAGVGWEAETGRENGGEDEKHGY